MSEKQELREDADRLEDDGEGPEELVPEGKDLMLPKLSIKAVAVRSEQAWGVLPLLTSKNQ